LPSKNKFIICQTSVDKPYKNECGVRLKKINQLISEMGFNEKSSVATQEAFIKYLVKISASHNVTPPVEKQVVAENLDNKIYIFPQQLSFNFCDELNQSSKKRKNK